MSGSHICVWIEGNSGVGKSTVASALAANLGLRCASFAEYHYFLDWSAGNPLPDFPPLSMQAVLNSNPIWIKAEQLRRAARVAALEADIHILDTSPISVVAYEIAKTRYGYFGAAADMAERFLSMWDSSNIGEPEHWIFLWASAEEIERRIARKGGTRPLLMRPEVISYLNNVRRIFADDYCGHGALSLNVEALSVEASVHVVKEFLRSTAPTRLQPLQRFLHDIVRSDALRCRLSASKHD